MATENEIPTDREAADGAPVRSWGDRIAGMADAVQGLLATRIAIFQAELDEKARHFGRGLVGVALATALGFGATLLFAALLAAMLSALFGSAVLGILAAMVLYLAGAAGAGWFAWKSLARVEPSRFPATARELSLDAEAIRAALARDPEPGMDLNHDDSPDEGRFGGDSEGDVSDLEARLRAGAE
jgi:uncharacterized membrane protein YqjE